MPHLESALGHNPFKFGQTYATTQHNQTWSVEYALQLRQTPRATSRLVRPSQLE
jgi:hypothetical protein